MNFFCQNGVVVLAAVLLSSSAHADEAVSAFDMHDSSSNRHRHHHQTPVAIELTNPDINDEENADSPRTSATSASNETSTTAATDLLVEPQQQCGLYITKSTIANSGLGLFVTRKLSRNQLIGTTSSDPIIGINVVAGAGVSPSQHLLRDYTWSTKFLSQSDQQSGAYTEAFVPGLGSVMNTHTAAVNAGPIIMTTSADNSNDDNDAHMIHFMTIADSIEAGNEIFAYYGDHWIEGRNDTMTLPLPQDYDSAEQILKKILVEQTDRSDIGSENDAVMAQRLYTAIHSEEVWSTLSEKVKAAIPETSIAMLQVARTTIQDYHQQQHNVLVAEDTTVKSVFESDITARCVDSIETKKYEASDDVGAFASRKLQQGETITGSPVLHLQQSSVPSEMISGCFGAAEASAADGVVLCPYGPGVTAIRMANDHLVSNQQYKRPNVRVDWAPNGHLLQNSALLDLPASELLKLKSPALALDYIALEDIAEGAELVLDVRRVAVPGQRFKNRASYWNFEQTTVAVILRTAMEQSNNPYPTSVGIQCHSKKILTKNSNEEKMAELTSSGVTSVDVDNEMITSDDDNEWNTCDIMERSVHTGTGEITYNVKLYTTFTAEEESPTALPELHSLGGVPRKFIRFFDRIDDTVQPMQFDNYPGNWINSEVPAANNPIAEDIN